MAENRISREKRSLGVGVVGGSTVVIDVGGQRFLTDPSLSGPGRYGYLTKTAGPAVPVEELGRPDAILLSHDEHLDNFDPAGREFAATVPAIITGPRAAKRLGGKAIGLGTWERTTVGPVTVEAVPAMHGPLDGDRDEHGDVNGETTGFVLSGDGLPTIYVSGDNAGIGPVADIAARHPDIDIAVLFVGAARSPKRNAGRPLTLTSDRATDAAVLLGAREVVPAHYQGWEIYTQSAADVRAAFADAGISSVLRLGEPGTWSVVG
jgi:L-ascorbate metabolism protein UlaG (beta-lactamase superfamily)